MGEGEYVSIFDLTELMGKHYPVNHVTLKLIDSLKPQSFQNLTGDQLENEHLKYAQMKITSKVAKFNFDEKRFIETLDVNNDDKL
jgi:hypothetical protein